MEANNVKKIREALEWLVEMACGLCCNEKNCELSAEKQCEEVSKAIAALAAPPRNCDIGTAREQAKRFELFCNQYTVGHKVCVDCPFANDSAEECAMRWAQMPYEAPADGEAKEGCNHADA